MSAGGVAVAVVLLLMGDSASATGPAQLTMASRYNTDATQADTRSLRHPPRLTDTHHRLSGLADAIRTRLVPASRRGMAYVRSELLPRTQRSLSLLRRQILPSLRRRTQRAYRRLGSHVLPLVVNATARAAADVAAGTRLVVAMVGDHVLPQVSAGAQMLRRKTEPVVSWALDRLGRRVLGDENHDMVKRTFSSALGQFDEVRSALSSITSEITAALSPAAADSDVERADAVEATADRTRDRSADSRGLFKDLVNGALYLAGTRVLGTNVTDALLPLARPLVNQIVPDRDPVSFDDGRIVFGFGSGPDKQDQAATSATSAADAAHRPCTTPQGGSGQCRDLSACPQLLLDLNNLRSSICFQQIFLPGVCCPSGTAVATTSSPSFPVVRPVTTARPVRPRPTTRPTSRPRPPPTVPRPVPVTPGQHNFRCGQPQAPEFRIVGGDVSRPGQWPWMAAIYLHGNQRKEFWCGGSLISKRYIMTAAHCTKDTNGKSFHPRQFTVRLGDYDLSSNDDLAAPAVYNVASYRTHPDFKINGFYNDLALFRLQREVDLNEYVLPVCLPVEYEGRALDALVGQMPSVIGWGTTFYGGQESAVLRQVQLPVWSQSDCDSAYFQPIREIFICAGYADGGKDACQGDSGGPLLYYENDHWMQIGIVSFGNRCAKPGYPGVYTRITHFLPWIRQNMA